MLDVLGIIAIVERGKADYVVKKAKEAGAQGATILYGRGTGTHEEKKLFNIHIESSKELIIILVEKDKMKPIYDAIVEAGKLNDPGTGIIFTLPVGNLLGLHHRDNIEE
ncbi:nitrogen regulatory protein P-II family [Proteiniborus ethanoligenes]|uniref:Nitrogen regulatory protein P-II family n=1 Tax=Proteiniborus ethanoligenes TaxID=415015 RepID=A0A1H3RQT0_9FIRM|nr:P-II family nitrogen regulator [Proteiniborus ethanoligenes]SDZ27980.1 nitrogen regulatory protein P-II family [Proteiniborus ethanoligenes]